MSKMHLCSNIINPLINQVEGYCIIKTLSVKSNVKGADYLDLTLADAGGEINAKLWDYSPEQHGAYQPQTVVKVRGTVSPFRDVDQLKIERIRNVNSGDTVDMRKLVPSAPFESEKMYKKIVYLIGDFKDEELKRICSHFVEKYRDMMLVFPAALKLHHAQRGGLLFHTTTMLDVAKGITDVYKRLYPQLRTELVYAGIILHDIAKMEELVTCELGLATGYSTKGQLLGHITMGASMIERAAAELGISEKTTNLLMHILLSHHGVPEFGSPRYPMFPEAEIVSEVDHLDAKMFTMYNVLDGVTEGEFSDRVWSLDNRQLYKHWTEETE